MYHGFVNCYRNDNIGIAGMLNPFQKMLKIGSPVNTTSKTKDISNSVNKALKNVGKIALKEPRPGNQLVLMTDASTRSAGYARMIDHSPEQKLQSEGEIGVGIKNLFHCSTQNTNVFGRIFGSVHGIFPIWTNL